MSFHLNDTTPAENSDTKQQEEFTPHPTQRLYDWVVAAYNVLNRSLFEGILPPCLLTLQRSYRAYGYFAGDRFANKNKPTEITDEIALNPRYFASCSPEEILSTLAHEMTHLWQHHNGHPSGWGYHNREFARKMREIGLIPSHTGKPGGRETGQQMSDYIAEGGPFAQACAAFLAEHEVALYYEHVSERDDYDDNDDRDDGDDDEDRDDHHEVEMTRRERERQKKAASKTKFTCASCGANAWGKADLKLICEACPQRMYPASHQGQALDPDDSDEVWAELRTLALSWSEPEATLLAQPEKRNYIVRNKHRSTYRHSTRLFLAGRRVRKKRLDSR